MQLTKAPSLKKMNRYTAMKKADRLWGPNASQGANHAHVRIRQKKVTNRFEVGYYAEATGKMTIMGAGPSWEAAFEQAARNEAAVIFEQTRHDVAASVARHAELEERLVPVLPDVPQWTADLNAMERAHVVHAVEQKGGISLPTLTPDIFEQTRHDVAASVARHAKIEEHLVPVLPDSPRWTADLDAMERAHVVSVVEQKEGAS